MGKSTMKFTSEAMPKKPLDVSCFVFVGRLMKRTPRTITLFEQDTKSPRST